MVIMVAVGGAAEHFPTIRLAAFPLNEGTAVLVKEYTLDADIEQTRTEKSWSPPTLVWYNNEASM